MQVTVFDVLLLILFNVFNIMMCKYAAASSCVYNTCGTVSREYFLCEKLNERYNAYIVP